MKVEVEPVLRTHPTKSVLSGEVQRNFPNGYPVDVVELCSELLIQLPMTGMVVICSTQPLRERDDVVPEPSRRS